MSLESPLKKRRLEPYILLPSPSPRSSPSGSSRRTEKPRSSSSVRTDSTGGPSFNKQGNGIILNSDLPRRKPLTPKTNSAHSLPPESQLGSSQSLWLSPSRSLADLNSQSRQTITPPRSTSKWRLESPLVETRGSSPDEMLLGNGQITSPSTFRIERVNGPGTQNFASPASSRMPLDGRKAIFKLNSDGLAPLPSSASASSSPTRGGRQIKEEFEVRSSVEREEEPPGPLRHVCLSTSALQRNQRIGKEDRFAIEQALESCQANFEKNGGVPLSCTSYRTITPAQRYVSMLGQLYGPGDIYRGHGRRPAKPKLVSPPDDPTKAMPLLSRTKSNPPNAPAISSAIPARNLIDPTPFIDEPPTYTPVELQVAENASGQVDLSLLEDMDAIVTTSRDETYPVSIL